MNNNEEEISQKSQEIIQKQNISSAQCSSILASSNSRMIKPPKNINNFDQISVSKSNQQLENKSTLVINIEKMDETESVHKRKLNQKQQKRKQQQFEKIKQYNLIEILVIQIIFGLHGILEGVSIGLQTSQLRLIIIGSSVIIHKVVFGNMLGICLKYSSFSFQNSLFMILFQSIMSPFGILIGWIISKENILVTGIFLAINAGTFLYISTHDVIYQEFILIRYKQVKYLFFLLGVAVISSLWVLQSELGTRH